MFCIDWAFVTVLKQDLFGHLRKADLKEVLFAWTMDSSY